MTRPGAVIEVDLDAIRANLRRIRAEIGPGPELCPVLKADAYGHGLSLVLPVLMSEGVGSIGIASNREAAEARELGFAGRLLRVRAAAPQEAAEALRFGVEEWVGGFAQARALAELALAHGASVPVHLATNGPGISRECLDLGGEEGARELAAILALRGLQLRGVCAHFPCEEVADTEAGAAAFAADAETVLRALGPERAAAVQRHCATSFAALSVPGSRFDLVRIGAALYGDSSADAPWQRRAMRLLAPVTGVNRYPAGRSVSYDRTHVLERDTLIASVPIGYGDGVPRSLGGRGAVLVRGRRAPVVGAIAMNALSVDVTAIPGVQPGDEAVLLGRQGALEITGAEFERAAGDIAAVAYSAWGRIVPRVAVGA
ncbi:alanine racemase [Leucobacter massiliensis]|uniref:alanine racemase n=1 Tax=Leucobacter massiliensis TaxID=1686285 RepID=UPI0015E491A0|nr:alanine racemase [Leucobacter massiliensis]